MAFSMNYRRATLTDCALLAELNQQLIADEGHRNAMTLPELERRMRGWLTSDYAALLFEEAGAVVVYCLYREEAEEVYLRQFFVVRDRRRRGIGRYAFRILRSKIWPRNKRLTVDALVGNTGAIAFWRVVGCRDYALTLEILPDTK